MDLVLDVFDTYLFDAVYAKLIPLSAFAASELRLSHNASATAILPSSSQWSKIVSLLPRPPISLEDASYSALSQSLQLSAWPRDYMLRQIVSLSIITLVGIHALYFIFAYMSYRFIFNHEMRRHPRFLKNQEMLEIACSLRAFPGMTVLTLPWFLAEARGHSRLYDGVDTYGYLYLFLSAPLFLLFTDYCIYWVHRILHVPAIYKVLHKPHHKWIIPTPFASHAFHPVDGYLQSVPYHLFIFLFPLHRWLYLGLFVFVNFWSIFIHDSDMITGHPLEKIINGPAHHTLHHLYFTVNYGQYFTWADRTHSSYRQPESSLDPLLEVKALKAAKSE
ncbi:Fatty acid hydroxylase [Mycena sanguinolenta]|uniref:Fatty acid hydroxylase n=1 Tax=Mycena sanguinolenta TaxID=230812 RepID=A0A8H7CYN1_9AGAR|nr:Fatty acid hydroxylase [Mycena sanguinolenta]